MKRKVFSFSLLASIGLFAFGVCALSGCSNTSFVAASVKLNKREVTLAVYESVQLKVSVSKGYGSDVRWFTSNESVAAVTEYGLVFALSEGEATITASIGGGYDDCKIHVSGEGEPTSTEYLVLNPSSKTIAVGGSFTLTANISPADATVAFASSDENIATVVSNGKTATITGVALGTASITATGSNGKTAVCAVTVSDGSVGPDRDIGVETDLNYSGELIIGSPLNQRDFMQGLLNEFNTFTGSSINFTVNTFEEDNGTSGFGSAAEMPALFPYASDQTLTLYQFNALSSIGRDDSNWIKTNMGDDAVNAAKLQSVVGFPFAADNGLVMFYNKSVVSEEDIDTLPELFAKAEELDYEINYSIGNGFYGAGALMTYSQGQSLYKLTPTTTSYTSSSTFNSAVGIKGAKLVRNIVGQETLRNATDAPSGDVLATITDVSKVQSFKKQMGSNYAVAPLPFVDENKTERLATYLGYKFYGVNNTLSAEKKAMAFSVAKFLCSEYVQTKRFDQYNVRPTLLSLTSYAANEPHVAALTVQQEAKATIPLTAISSELWSGVATAVTSIKALSSTAADNEFASILEVLDSQLKKTA